MRGSDGMQEALFTVAKLEDFVPVDHPLRPIRLLVNEALGRLNGLFNLIYADSGRASIAPEKLLRAMLVQDRDRASIGLGAVQSFQAVDADSLVALPGDTTGAPSYPSGKPVLTTGLPDGYGPAAVSVQQSTPARTRLG